jgi:hypothetical protein
VHLPQNERKKPGSADVSSASSSARSAPRRAGRPRSQASLLEECSFIQMIFEYVYVFAKSSACSRRLDLGAKQEDGLLRGGWRSGNELFRWTGSQLVP